MKRLLCATIVAGGLAASASASTLSSIDVQYFTDANAFADINAAFTFGPPSWEVENFEVPTGFTGNFEDGTPISAATTTNFGEIEDSIGTSVGSFTTIGGTGTGTTCTDVLNRVGDDCDNIALQIDPPNPNGQGNIIPGDGVGSINSADTKGVIWTLDTGSDFSQAVFALRDPGDQKQKRLTIRDGHGELYSEFMPDFDVGNEDLLLVRVFFGTRLSTATIEIETSENDAFTLDGAAVNVVPLPAGVWMLLAGMGGLLAMKRRKAA